MEATEHPTCQHCGEAVTWSPAPKDVTWAAFVHVSTGTTACTEATR